MKSETEKMYRKSITPKASSHKLLIIPIWMAKIKNRNNTIFFWKKNCGKPGSLTHCWGEWKMIQPLWQIDWQFLIKLSIQLPVNSSIAHLGLDHKENYLDIKPYTQIFIEAFL